ncbi:MAG TPA: zf-HC2 domain-containing protein [Gemmatimonadaceae bacterium]
MNLPDNADHLTELELAAYIDRGLSGDALTRAENHIAECAECRDHLIETRRLLDRTNRPKRFAQAAGVLVAAGLAGILLLNPGSLRRASDANVLRRGNSSGDAITVYGPIGEIARQPPRFVWASPGEGTSYRIVLTNDAGEQVWTTSTADTTISLPASVRLTGEHYYWSVDALTADGRTLVTGLREFRIKQ